MPRGPNRVLVATALGLELTPRQVPPRDVDVLRDDVELGEQIFPHEPMVGVHAPGIHRVVLIEVESDHLREAEPLLPMHADELAIHADGRRSRRQTEHGAAARCSGRTNYLGDPPSD